MSEWVDKDGKAWLTGEEQIAFLENCENVEYCSSFRPHEPGYDGHGKLNITDAGRKACADALFGNTTNESTDQDEDAMMDEWLDDDDEPVGEDDICVDVADWQRRREEKYVESPLVETSLLTGGLIALGIFGLGFLFGRSMRKYQ